MTKEEQLKIIKQGTEVWNEWRKIKEIVDLDLSRANLSEANLSGVNLSGVNLSGVNLSDANLKNANLKNANLKNAELSNAELLFADFTVANLYAADLSRANLTGANFAHANLSEATLVAATLYRTNFYATTFGSTNFTDCQFMNTVWNDTDMSGIKGLPTIIHFGPSSVSIDTLYFSKGTIPDIFLWGCGIPEEFIRYLPSLLGSKQVVQYYSCFISYSSIDGEFAKRLHSRMQQEKLRVWFAPEDIAGGKKIFDQIDEAIQVHDKLLLVLSEESMKSEWVITEVRRALKTEKKENRRKLFPIRIVDFKKIKEWELKDADTGKDLAFEIREYFIPDFSHWKNHDEFEAGFKRLLKDLKAEEK